MDPNRRRRTRKLEHEAGTAAPDPELAKLSDEELRAEYELAMRDADAAEAEAMLDPETRELVRSLRRMTDGELLAYHAAVEAEAKAAEAEVRAREAAPPEPVITDNTPEPEPPVEPHEVVLEPERPAAPRVETERERWHREQDEKIRAAIAEEIERGERVARMYHDLPDEGRYDGPMFGSGE